MNTDLTKKLRCPQCLSRFERKGNRVVCLKNNHTFAVRQGIPVLLDSQNLDTHSKNQKILFEKITKKRSVDSVIYMKPHELNYLERLSKNIKNIKNKHFIEIGTGTGYMAFGLAKQGAKVVACDITFNNLVMLKGFARKLGLESNFLFICCSADSLPFQDNSFDYLVINAVLEHIPDEKKAINEIRRTLKKGGGLMITVPLMYKFIFPLLLPLNIFHDKRIGHLRRYDDVSLRKKFSGFSLKQVYFTGHIHKVIKVIVNMIVKIFDEKRMEIEDAKSENRKFWASNVIAFFYKK